MLYLYYSIIFSITDYVRVGDVYVYEGQSVSYILIVGELYA